MAQPKPKSSRAAKRFALNRASAKRITRRRMVPQSASHAKRLKTDDAQPLGRPARPDSKQAKVLAMLKCHGGTTINAISRATGWQPHSVRGFLAGVVRKRLRLNLRSERNGDVRRYLIDSDGSLNGTPATTKAV